jgi:hypothetical protein
LLVLVYRINKFVLMYLHHFISHRKKTLLFQRKQSICCRR